MTAPVATRIAVGGAFAGGEALELAAWVFPPASAERETTLLLCSHGGTLTKHYWHLDGHPGYSFAEHMAGLGFTVVAFDQLGVGESSLPADLEGLTSLAVAIASHELADQVTAGLTDGSLVPGLAPVRPRARIGIGHSFGGWMTIRQQGRHASFDAVAILGTTLLELQFSRELAERREQLRPVVEPLSAGVAPEVAEQRVYRALGGRPASTVSYTPEVLRIFHADDVPSAIIEADAALAGQRRGAISCATMVPGAFAADAAAIDVPVFLGFGERDVSPDPRAEVAEYRSSPDTTLQMLAGSAHCHNYASSRVRQWDRLATWASALPAG
jgi:pimeloyl-ACP methyl ester carboxylesterase